MSQWYLIELRQRTLRKATFECIFEVQGRTRNISSLEEDVKVVLWELFPPWLTYELEVLESRLSRSVTLYELLREVFPPTPQIPLAVAPPSGGAPVAAGGPVFEPVQAANQEFISGFLAGLQWCAIFSWIVSTLSDGIQSLCAG